MVKHSEVVLSWLAGNKLKGSRMFTDGKIIYSYGEHFPIACFIGHSRVLVNNDRYSSSTSNHQGRVIFALMSRNYEIIRCNTSTIKHYISYPNEPIVIEREKDIDNIDDVLKQLRIIMKKKGMSRYPSKKVEDFLSQLFVSKMI